MKLLRKVILWAFATWALSLLAFWVTATLYSYEQELKFRKQLLSTQTSQLINTFESTFKNIVDQSRLSWNASQIKEGKLSNKTEIEKNLQEYWSLQAPVARFQVFRRKGSHTDFEWTLVHEWESENAPSPPFELAPRFSLAFDGFIETLANKNPDTENPPSLYFAISVKREKYSTPKELLGVQMDPKWTIDTLQTTLKDFAMTGTLVSPEGIVFSTSDPKRYPAGSSLKHLPLVQKLLASVEARDEASPAVNEKNNRISGAMNFKPFPKEPEVMAEYQELAGTGWFLITHAPYPTWKEHLFLQRKGLPMILYAALGIMLALSLFALSTLNLLRRSLKTKHFREQANGEIPNAGPKELKADFTIPDDEIEGRKKAA